MPKISDAFANAAKRIIENSAHRDALVSVALDRAKAFRWKRTAQTVLQLYDRLDEQSDA